MPSASINRFGELIDSIKRIASMAHYGPISQRAAHRQAQLTTPMLIEFSPEAIPGRTLMTTGHSHTPIIAGWRGPFTQGAFDGATSTIENVSEHIDVQRMGTERKNYPIPIRRGMVKFWLGTPLMWPVRKAKFRKPGFVRMAQVIHPGIEPHGGKDFVETVADKVRPELTRVFRDAGMQIAFEPLRKFFDG